MRPQSWWSVFALLFAIFVLSVSGCGRAAEPAPTFTPIPAATASPIPTPFPTVAQTQTEEPPTTPNEWVFRTGGEVFSSAALSPDSATIYFGSTDYNVYALDIASGEVIWTFETGDQVVSSPALLEWTLYIGSADGNLYALDARTGSVLWATPLGLIVAKPAVAGEIVYSGAFIVDENSGDATGAIIALSAGSGREIWRRPVNGYQISSPAIDDGVVYTGSPTGLLALNALTGDLLWEAPIGFSQSSPFLTYDMVYIGAENGNLYALDRSDGIERWRFATGGSVISSPKAAGDLVYTGSEDGNIYAVDFASGEEVWRLATNQPVISSPLIDSGVLYIGSSDGRLYAIDAASGDLEWTFAADDAVWASPVVDASRVYFGSFDRNFYALDRNGPRLVSAGLPQPTPLASQPTPLPDPVPPATSSDGELPWWNDRIFYEVFVRSFSDSDGDGIGDFQGLIDKLDYLNDGDPATTDDLGITGIWLMPIAQSPSYHGYDVTDYLTIEEDYGTNADMQRFLEEAHARGIAVIVDLVMNHTSSEHPWFLEARQPGTPRETWYIWDATPDFWQNPWGGLAWHQNVLRYYFGMFWRGMPDLNYRNGEVTDAMYDIIRFWLDDMAVDGFRLDAVRHLIEDGDIQANTPETHAWLQGFHRYVHGLNPDALTVGEIWDTTANVAPYVGDELNIAFEFDIGTAIKNALLIKNATTLTKAWGQVLAAYPEGQYAPFLTNHDQDRIMNQLRKDEDAMKAAAALYLTSPGVPFIYFGEEIGQLGIKPDEDIRRPMAWDDSPMGGFTSGEPWRALPAEHEKRNVAVQDADPGSLLNHYRDLIALRNAHPALRTGSMTLVESSSRQLFTFLRQEGDEAILVLVNVDDDPASDYTLSLAEGPLAGVSEASVLWGDGPVVAPEVNPDGGFDVYTPVPEVPSRGTLIVTLR
jgi:alpha-amylase